MRNVSDEARKVQLAGSLAGTEMDFGSLELRPREERSVSGTFLFPEAEEWSMEQPKLYSVKVSLSDGGRIVDDLIDRVGFRTVSVEGNRILVNGRAVRIKGFCRHEDHPMFGCALRQAASLRRISVLDILRWYLTISIPSGIMTAV